MKFPRRSGILLHPTSLPGPFGIGDLGSAAYQFADFLAAAGQAYWQVLPLSPTGYADSPYQGLSAFAGNPMLISLEKLVHLGHLSANDLKSVPDFPVDRVDYGWVIGYKTDLLNRAFANFRESAPDDQKKSFDKFCKQNTSWLDDVALFMALKETHNLAPWYEWEPELATRKPAAIAAARQSLAIQIENQKYRQWQFFEQWLALKLYANGQGIRIIGDTPIYVAMDSADVWANPSLFLLDRRLKPIAVAGVPPDYFSATGQLWGNPLYRWDAMAKSRFAWWIERFRMTFTQTDIVRIDHFRAFYNYWAVPAGLTTAVKGRWIKGPGSALFHAVTRALGDVAIIAEDLGEFDKKSRAGVTALQEEFGFPGMKVVQFAFGNGPTDPFLPHNFTQNYVAYTGTHDNDTVAGWYTNAPANEGDYARRYLARDGSDIVWDLIRLTWSSVAHTVITTVQDLLQLGHDTRYNTPSTIGAPNWCWRLAPDALNNTLPDQVATRLRELTWVYGRTE
jgi:4-alpha-glucanotransferase